MHAPRLYARADSFSFFLGAAYQGKSVGELVREAYSPTFPDGSKMEVMPQYASGEDFGAFVCLWPAHMFSHPLPDGREMNVVSDWTRLDAASMSNLDLWRDPAAARRQAWEALRPYVEGGDDVPVPRPD